MWLFMVPSFVVMAAVLFLPILLALYYSFTSFYLDGRPLHLAGLSNYLQLLQDERFWGDLLTTIIVVGCSVLLQLVVGFLLALCLYSLQRGARLFSTLNFLPQVITPVVGGMFLKWIFVGRWGLLDSTLIAFGINPPNWLGDPAWAIASLVIADTWRFAPFLMLVFYAGLQSFDTGVLEAAQIDGATGLQRVRYIILPMMKPLIFFMVAMRTMDAFRFFDLVYILTGGGPGTATETVTLYTYDLAFTQLNVGKASALGVITLLITAAIIAAIIAAVIVPMQRRGKAAF